MAKDDVKIKIGAQDKASAPMDKIGKNATKMGTNFKKVGIAMTAVGAGLVLALGKMVNSYSKAGDEVAKMAKRTGFGTEALSELRHAAELSGSSLASIEKATKKMSMAVVEARDGVATYTDIFDKLGVNIAALEAQKPEEQFWTLANAMASLEDHTEKVAVAQELFGRAGADLIPLLDSGTEAIAEMRQEAHDLNVVFSEEAAQAAEEFEDSKTRLKTAFAGIGAAISKEVMPQMEELIKGLTERLKVAMEWFSDHPEAAQALIKFGVAAATIMAVGGPIMMLVHGIKTMIVSLIALHAVMGPAGWIKLAAGIGIAAGAIAGFKMLMSEEPKRKFPTPPSLIGTLPPTPPPVPPYSGKFEIPSLQFGGTVPGPTGMPRLITAHGGEQVGRGGGNTIILNVHGSIMTERDLVEVFREELIRIGDRNTTTGL